MIVPFLDLSAAYLELKDEIDEAINRVLSSGRYVLGAEVQHFEWEFARFTDSREAIGVGSGLDALRLALASLDIGRGDEVIVPANTYIATWLAVSQSGATPVGVEPTEAYYTLDPDRIEEKITSKTRAIIPVHLYGQAADMDPILQIAESYNLNVIEDAAQAHGGSYKRQRIGRHGDLVAWSFYPSKNLGALGDGGAITTNDEGLASRLRCLRNYGEEKKYHFVMQGFNSRLDEMQAAVLRVKLRCLEDWNRRRKGVAETYLSTIKHSDIVLPRTPSYSDPVWHLFVIRSRKRDTLARALEEQGIATLIHYPIPPHLSGAYCYSDQLPITERLGYEILSLPIGPHLSVEQATWVADIVNSS